MSELFRVLLALLLMVLMVVTVIRVARRYVKHTQPSGYQKSTTTSSRMFQVVGIVIAAVVAIIIFAYAALFAALGSGSNMAPEYFFMALYGAVSLIIVLALYWIHKTRPRQ